MLSCECQAEHAARRVVVTGGPGAGKTAVLQLVRQTLCEHVYVVAEAATIVFGGGFPRLPELATRRAAQRAIFKVQRELEAVAEAHGAAVVLCDRGTLDSLAYYPGDEESFWREVQSTRAAELARYHAVIHLRPAPPERYDRSGLRIETADEARWLDLAIERAWEGHPRRFFVGRSESFFEKAAQALALIRDEVPACCQERGVARSRRAPAGAGDAFE